MSLLPLNSGVWCVAGSRLLGDADFVDAHLCLTAAAFEMPRVIVHGGCRGADSLAHAWALRSGIAVQVWRADWKLYGNAAGPIRTRAMLHGTRPALLVAFGAGAGTRYACKVAAAIGSQVEYVAWPA